MSMFDEVALLEKLRKIETLYAGATTEGEQEAAANAAARIRQRLQSLRATEPDVEWHYSLTDPWSQRLFIALCRRYGLQPFRRPRQRRTSLCVRAPRLFLDHVLWPQFLAMNEGLTRHLATVTEKVIAVAVHQDESEAPVLAEPKGLPG